MALTARASFKKLKKRLEDAPKLAFQRVCCDLLSLAWPDLQYAPELGVHDRRGADLFSFYREASDTPEGVEYDLVVQCKGVEHKELDKGNYEAAIRSVETFCEAKLRARRYWLVLNRSATAPGWAARLDRTMNDLVACGAAGEARWLDPQSLLLVLFEELITQGRRRIAEKNVEQLARYSAAMRKHDEYVADVPYRVRIRRGAGRRARWVEHVGRNAVEALAAPSREASQGAQRFRLIVSEFGFGKTLLLLQLANRLGQSEHAVLYQPMVELARDCGATEFALVKSIYERLFPEDETANKTADHPPLAAFREVLRLDTTTVLLLDGLDEFLSAYNFEGLRDLFRALRDLSCDVVMSVRKEFFDAYAGNFDEAMRGTGNDRQVLSLDEWDPPCIVEFLASYGESRGIQIFRERIRSGEYDFYYGDIPRRPLFLEMLASDLSEDPDATVDLAALYRHYLERKMSRDVQTPFEFGSGGGRPLPHTDLAPFRAKLIALQEQLAAASLEHVEGVGELVFRGEVTEDEVRAAASDVGLDPEQLPQLLQHSVLMPSGKTARAALLLRFAHRSLQEFLAASWLVQNDDARLLAQPPSLPAGVLRFAEQIRRSTAGRGLDRASARHRRGEPAS